MPTATVTTKGQITHPRDVRKALGLDAGDKVDFVEVDGGFKLVPLRKDVRALATCEKHACGFADAVIAASAKSAGCRSIVSFDRGAVGAGMTLLR